MVGKAVTKRSGKNLNPHYTTTSGLPRRIDEVTCNLTVMNKKVSHKNWKTRKALSCLVLGKGDELQRGLTELKNHLKKKIKESQNTKEINHLGVELARELWLRLDSYNIICNPQWPRGERLDLYSRDRTKYYLWCGGETPQKASQGGPVGIVRGLGHPLSPPLFASCALACGWPSPSVSGRMHQAA